MAKIPEGLSCPVTPEQAYPNGVPPIPEGWEFVGFRGPHKDEYHVADTLENGKSTVSISMRDQNYPRIIVRHKPEPKPEPLPPPSSPWAEEEMSLANQAAWIAGLIPADQALSVSDMHSIVMRLRAIDRAKLLAAEISTMYKLAVKAKPTSCPGNPGIMPTPHCPCTDKCCFCHYEKQKATRARRWVVELPCEPDFDLGIYGKIGWPTKTIEVIREVKPITRQQLVSMIIGLPEYGHPPFLQEQLRKLGIEVED